MPSPAPPLVLLLVLLAGSATALAQQERAPPGVRQVHLEKGTGPEPVEVYVSAGRLTTLLFDTPVEGVELEAPTRFQRVRLQGDSLQLIPAASVAPGDRVRLTVRFARDGALPESSDFGLVGHAALAESQVEVFRRPRPPAAYAQEARDAREAEGRCQQALQEVRAELGRPEGLAGLRATGLMGTEGILARVVTRQIHQRASNVLTANDVFTYTAWNTETATLRVAVEVRVANPPESPPWQVAGAALVGPLGNVLATLPPWQPAAIAPGERGIVIIQAVVKERLQGAFTLSLWAADGRRTVTLRNITFP